METQILKIVNLIKPKNLNRKLKQKIIFVHIPKTAGNSIIKSLRKRKDFEVVSHNLRSLDYKFLKDRVGDYGDNKFIFTFVRNPWDRAVSAFFYLNGGGNGPGDEADQLKYLEQYKGDFRLFVKNAFLDDQIFNQIHFKPQYEWICDGNGKILADFVGKFKNFDQDLKKVKEMTGLKFNILPHINKSKHGYYKDYYDDETKEIIRRAYQKDIELFRYDF